MAKIEWNEDGFRELEKNINEALSDLTVLDETEGSEEDAIRDLTAQVERKGMTIDHEEAQRIVRQARQG